MPNGAGDMIIDQACLSEGERFEKFKALATAAKANGSLIIGQLTHPGRQVQSSLSPTAISASDVQLGLPPFPVFSFQQFAKSQSCLSCLSIEPKHHMSFGKPHPATKEEIKQIANDFAHASEYLEKAGFDGIELHGAHGYLISQFLSRTTNLRTDEYGVQTMENRLRFLSEIVHAIRSRVSSKFVIAAKLNSVEFQDGGITPDEARAMIEALEKKMNLDYVQLSGGTYEDLGLEWKRDSTKIREGFFLEFARTISEALGPGRTIRLYLAGGMRSVEAMLSTLDAVDGVALARPAAMEPRLCSDIIEGRVPGAIKPLDNIEDDFFLNMVAAGAQIWQIGRGKEPLQLNSEATVAKLRDDIGSWMNNSNGGIQSRPLAFTGPETAYGEMVAGRGA